MRRVKLSSIHGAVRESEQIDARIAVEIPAERLAGAGLNEVKEAPQTGSAGEDWFFFKLTQDRATWLRLTLSPLDQLTVR